jgi:hypothetical protein
VEADAGHAHLGVDRDERRQGGDRDIRDRGLPGPRRPRHRGADRHPAAWLVTTGAWILAVRVALVVLLEGSFNFDSIEIATALMGNLAHSPVQGGLRVFLKYALPIFVSA